MRNPYQDKIESFYKNEKRMPSYSEMAKLFGFKSKNAVFKIVEKLLDAGLVTKDKLGRLLPSSGFGEVSRLGSVTAGLPMSVEEESTEKINLEDLLIKNNSITYLLDVDGDSMIEAHIEDGDMVLVERTNTAKDGDIVIANVDGEFTMKYLKEKNGKRYLQPANKNYKPIYPEINLDIVGKVKAVIRKY